MVAHPCDPTLGRSRQEEFKYQGSLGYIAGLGLEKQGREEQVGGGMRILVV